MTIEDAVSSTRGNRARARKFGYGLIAGATALALAGCGAGDTYIDGWWDNEDPILVPAKSSLFDAEGLPLCSTPTAFGQVETRSRSYGELGGVINSFLFEIVNPETDPSTGETAFDKKKLEVLQDSPKAMYELTFPSFDEKHDIKDASDMRKIKEEFQEHIPNLLTEGLVTDYAKIDDQWIEGPAGKFSVTRASNVEDYIKENNLPIKFNGVANQYFIAKNQDGGEEWLIVKDKNTGTSTMMRNGAENIVLDDQTESFTRFTIENDIATGVNPDATITLVNDQCLPSDGSNVARFWVYDYELLNGTEQKPVDLQ